MNRKRLVVLALASFTAIAVGAALLLFPVAFRASYGIGTELTPGALSEIRAPGGALVALGLLMAGSYRASGSELAGLRVAGATLLGYGLARLVSLVLDGVPPSGLLMAALFELVLGASAAVLSFGPREPELRRAQVSGSAGVQRIS
jgi:hypothetical protein